MLVVFATEAGATTTIDINPTSNLQDVKVVVEAEFGIPIAQQVFVFNTNVVPENSTLAAAGVQENDIVMVFKRNSQPSQPTAPSAYAPTRTPHRQLQPRTNQALASAAIAALDRAMQVAQTQPSRTLDPFDPDYQKRIEQEIQQQNVLENMANAIEHSPEAFARVYMLYIDCKVNGLPSKAFVDSGAQVTIMSKSLAEKCNLMRLMDKRFAGEARGVGKGAILGRVHLAPIEIGGQLFNCTFAIMDDPNMDLLFGLDMLKRHQCCIDLKANCLRVGSADVTVPFLDEKDLPEHARLIYEEHPQTPTQTPAQTQPSTAQGQATTTTTTQTQAQSTAPTPAPAPAPIQTATFPAESIQALVDLGLPQEQAIAALQQTNGNVQLAAELFLS